MSENVLFSNPNYGRRYGDTVPPVEGKTGLEAVDASNKVRDKIYSDSLTGCFNRTYFDERIKLDFDPAADDGRLGFVFIDIDDFKDYNSRFGHAGGDQALVKVADYLKNVVRAEDYVARYGGDEFVIVCVNSDGRPDFESQLAQSMAEKIRNAPVEIDTKDGIVKVKLSLGCAVYDKERDQGSVKAAIDLADDRMSLQKDQKNAA